MIRCGAFCLSMDPETAEAASSAAIRIERSGVRARTLMDIPAGGDGGGQLVSLDFEGTGLPVIHGWLGEEAGAGEYTGLAQTDQGVEAFRDYCGTRPLYVAKSGRWAASDHRFFPDEPKELLPRGARLAVSEWRVNVPTAVRERFAGTFDDATKKLASLVDDSVRKRVEGKRRVAVAFSGGLDSSILAHCAAKHSKVVACCVSAVGSRDSGVAGDTAGAMGIEFASARVDGEGAEKELRSLDLPFEPSPMDRGLWCIYSMTARLAAECRAEVVLLGQLADELFGGYAKYEASLRNGDDAEAEKLMSADVAECGMSGFVRDEAACSKWCEPRFPFAEQSLARYGESLPVSFKIRNGVRKAVLREAALRLGLPEEIARRPKKAAQYSSGMMKLLG